MRPAIVCLTFLATLVPNGRAQTWQNAPPPQHRLVYRDLSSVRINPIGLSTDARISYRYRLYRDESVMLRDNFVSIGLAPALTGAAARIGLYAELQPLSMLQLWANYEVVQFFDASMFRLQSFKSAAAPVSDEILDQLGTLPATDPRRSYAAGGTQLTLGVNLQAKVKSVVVRSQARFIRPDYELRAGDHVYYDIVYDIVAPNRGWTATNDADLLWKSDWGLTAGLRWTWTSAFYGPEHLAANEVPVLDTTHRVGPVVAYELASENGKRFNQPTLLLVAQWWTKHSWRTGQEGGVSQAIPCLVLAFAFNGDLFEPTPD